MPKEKALSIPKQSPDNNRQQSRYIYSDYARALREKYGRPVYRVGVDGGFSCPNRCGDRHSPGCSYCDAFGALSTYQRDPKAREAPAESEMEQRLSSLSGQIHRGIAFLRRRYGANDFILYFQAFSSTHDSVEHLKALYDTGLSQHPFIELAVSTRPDCIDQARTDLLGSYITENREVWVELGLQSSHDKTLKRIERGHDLACFERAYELLRDRGIKIALHLVFGLPGEDLRDIEETIVYVRSLRPEGVKIHNLHIPVGTALSREYLAGELAVPSLNRHMEYAIHALERLPREVLIMRLTCDTPANRLLVPHGGWTKGEFYARFRKEMTRRKTWQGRQLDN